MDIKVNQVSTATSVEKTAPVQQTDGNFKFTLASHIEEAELQERLSGLMEQITMEGEKLAKRKDLRDMKHYRGLVKAFMNEIISRSHSFPERISWTGREDTESTALYGWWIRIWTTWPRN